MYTFIKAVYIVLGALTGLVIVIAIDSYTSDTPQSTCNDITRDNKVVGQTCIYDRGPILERTHLEPDACFSIVEEQRGAKYAAYACPSNDRLLEKRPL